MKKFAFLGLVLVLLAASVMPVLAAGPKGHGNGANTGQGNGGGNPNRGLGIGHGRNKNNNLGLNGNENQGNTRMRMPFYLQGTIKSIGASTITVEVHHGNARVKNFIGGTLTLTVITTGDNMTKIFRINQGTEDGETVGSEVGETVGSDATSENLADEETPGNKVAISFGELKAEDIVAIHGNVVMSGSTKTYIATLITVHMGTFAGLPETETP